jgi:hypothetical protein
MANNSAFGVSHPCTSCLGRSITTHKRDTNAYYTSIARLFNPSSRIIRTDEKTGSETHDCHMIRITRQGLNFRQEQQGKLTREKKSTKCLFSYYAPILTHMAQASKKQTSTLVTSLALSCLDGKRFPHIAPQHKPHTCLVRGLELGLVKAVEVGMLHCRFS